MPGASTTVANNLASQAIVFDENFIPPAMGNTAAFLIGADERKQPENSGVNRNLFSYDLLTNVIPTTGDGVPGAGGPEFFGMQTIPVQIAENAAYANFSAFAVHSSIDPDQVENTAKLLAYQTGITISKAASTALDDMVNIDANVNRSSTLVPSPYTGVSIVTLRDVKDELFTLNFEPIKGGMMVGQIHPYILSTINSSTTTNASIVDFLKFTQQGQDKYNEIAGITNQWQGIDFGVGVGTEYHVSTFVTSTANYESTGSTAYRTYCEAKYGLIGVWLPIPGDTGGVESGDWKRIDCQVVQNAGPNQYDPTGQIPAWCSARWHVTFTPPPQTGTNSMRVRWFDALPATV